MDISAIIGAVSTGHGIPSLVLAIVIYAIVQVLDILLKRFRESMNKQAKIKGMVKREEADSVITSLLNAAVVALGGDRIQVVEFSNTDKNVALVPFKYMNCTYESYAIGKEPKAETIQRLFTSLYAMLLMRLNRQSYIILDVQNPDKELPNSSYEMMKKRNAIKTIYVPVHSPTSKKMIGFISYDTNGADMFADKTLTMMRSLSDQIGTLLTLGEW